MSDPDTNIATSEHLRQRALSRWDTEGGAGPHGSQEASNSGALQAGLAMPANIEIAQLRVRVIALENLVITLLAEASDRQLNLAHEMASYISPRIGFRRHPLTMRAAAHMIDLVERASQFRVKTPS
jgi:kynureninase